MDIVSAVIICSIVAIIVYKNIQQISQNNEDFKRPIVTKDPYSVFVDFSIFIQEQMKNIIEKVSKGDSFYILSNGIKKDDVVEELKSFIKKLSVFETVYMKNKSQKELEEKMFDILNDFDLFLNINFKNGEELGNHYREVFKKQWLQRSRK